MRSKRRLGMASTGQRRAESMSMWALVGVVRIRLYLLAAHRQSSSCESSCWFLESSYCLDEGTKRMDKEF